MSKKRVVTEKRWGVLVEGHLYMCSGPKKEAEMMFTQRPLLRVTLTYEVPHDPR